MSDELNTQEENAEAPIETTELEEMELTPEAQIEALKIELEEAKAQVLYVKAEGENIRRRSFEDVDKARKFALEKFSGELLAVKDSLDAALAVESATVDSYKNGVELTAKQLLSVFEKFNIAEVNPTEEKFDPNKHQAISTIESEGEPNTVLSVLQKGYTLNDRVLRPALVVVSKAK
ncbi:MAG: nucleotide exchange factor GrpE [Betaproteobacteria bacterium]|jgi:molecular chaperone GrpE|nr:nucleotide exchange factor GrpE [Betaproteobacteria bacterium]MCH9849244.1 nucleotide exchange factor GrpE [Betaproteobacteria bacterium]